MTDKPSDRILPTPPPTIYTYTTLCPKCGFTQEFHTYQKPEYAEYSMTCNGCSSMDKPETRTDTRIY